jgi:multiple sugar transport system permease protein
VKRLAIIAGVLLVLAFSWGPLLWAVVTSLKPSVELTRLPPILPSRITFASYPAVFDPARHFGRVLLNSLVVASATTALSLLIGASAAFALARLEFPGRRVLLAAALGVSMFPPIATVSPLYLVIRALGLRDTLPGLVIPDVTFALPLTMWTLTQHFRAVPIELYQAARIDGCTPFDAFRKVLLPLAMPGVAATAILVFIATWNEFLYALTFTATERARTVPVGIALFPGVHEVPWGELSAASVIVTLPLVLVVLLFQQRITEGLTAGAVKG